MKKRILVFNGYYLPAKNYGGPTASIYNITENLYTVYDFYLIVHNHDFGSEEKFADISEGWNIIGHANVKYVSDNEFTYQNMKKWMEEIKADMVYFCGLYSFRCVKGIIAAKKISIPVLLPPRGELSEEAIKIKKYKKIPFLTVNNLIGLYKNIYIHATTESEVVGAKKYLNINEENIFLLPNMPKPIMKEKKHRKKKNSAKVVYIARICRIKNLLNTISLLNKINGELNFDIYGVIEDESYWCECKNEMKNAPHNVHYSYKGALNPEDVCKTYNDYDYSICLSLSENYGHSIVEAMVSSCPIIILKGTTPWDDIDGIAGYTLELNDEEKCLTVIENIISMDENDYIGQLETLQEYVEKKFRPEEIAEEYVKMFSKVINSRKG